MQNFDYHTPTRLIFGKDSITKLPSVMKPLGKRILLTYGGGSIKRSGLYSKVTDLLKGFEIYELPGIQPNPKYSTSVVDGVKLCKENDIDAILAVGGGSVLDCSKAIAAGARYDGETWDLISRKAYAEAALPIVDIIMLDCTYGCNGILSLGNSASGWPCHAIEHALSAYYDITHGEGLAIITPRWMKHILSDRTLDKYEIADMAKMQPTVSLNRLVSRCTCAA